MPNLERLGKIALLAAGVAATPPDAAAAGHPTENAPHTEKSRSHHSEHHHHKQTELRHKEHREYGHAFGTDPYGKPFGWGFQTRYIHGPEDSPSESELSEPFYTREITNKDDGTPDLRVSKLRAEVYHAFQDLGAEFEVASSQDPELKEIGFWATEAGRDAERQKQLRAELGTQAASENMSEHQLFTAIDFRFARFKPFYEFAMGSREDWKNKEFIPRFVRHGFVPTMRIEPWHFRYVGPELAAAYWKKYHRDITRTHGRHLSDWPPPEEPIRLASAKQPRKRR